MQVVDEKDSISKIDLLKSDDYFRDAHRNLVVIAGQNSVGKTTACTTLVEEAKIFGIPYESRPISRLFFLLNNLSKDDALGGFHHYHEWCEKKEDGHSHTFGEPELPFTLISNTIIDNTSKDFFTALSDAPIDRLVFVEWSGGKNINPLEQPASRVDSSFERIGHMLRNGTLPNAWLDRVRMIIHPTADNETRYILNERKHSTSWQEIQTGKCSPKKDSIVLDMFGEDDFFTIEDLFHDHAIPITIINNEGTWQFYEQLQVVSREITSQSLESETQLQPLGIAKRRFL